MRGGRIKNSVRNIAGAIGNKFVGILFPFIIRSLIIYYLGIEYAGLNSLFTSILQILSFSELGIGSAIVFSMYKPIADNDIMQVNALLSLYKKFYNIVGSVILLAGFALLPFIEHLIDGTYPNDINLHILYVIYLLNTAVSYFLCAYKSSILIAHQRSDIDINIITTVNICMYIIQIAFLVLFKNYYLYIIVLPISTIVINVIRSRVIKQRFPQFKCMGNVPIETRKDIKKRVSSLIGHQLSGVVNCSLDNVVVSAFLGLKMVAQYGNYYYIVSSLSGVMQVVFNALTASIGNSLITDSTEKNKKDFFDLQYLNCWIVGWLSICMMCLYQDFMMIWVGKEQLLSLDIVALFVLYFYSWQCRRTVITYKNACGMWTVDKYKPYVSVICNLFLNFSLINIIGIRGVLLSTIVCYLFIEAPWETIAFFKKYFAYSSVNYWMRLIRYTIIILVNMIISYIICQSISVCGIGGLLLKLIVCCIIPNILWLLFTCKEPGLSRVLKLVMKKEAKT